MFALPASETRLLLVFDRQLACNDAATLVNNQELIGGDTAD
jgi:hypothetical protein